MEKVLLNEISDECNEIINSIYIISKILKDHKLDKEMSDFDFYREIYFYSLFIEVIRSELYNLTLFTEHFIDEDEIDSKFEDLFLKNENEKKEPDFLKKTILSIRTIIKDLEGRVESGVKRGRLLKNMKEEKIGSMCRIVASNNMSHIASLEDIESTIKDCYDEYKEIYS